MQNLSQHFLRRYGLRKLYLFAKGFGSFMFTYLSLTLIQKGLVQKPVHQSSTNIERKLGRIVADF